MRNVINQCLCAMMVCLCVRQFAYASGGMPVGATEFTQILNNIELIGQTINQAEMMVNQMQMIQHQLEQLKSIETFSKGEWRNAQTELEKLSKTIWKSKDIVTTAAMLEKHFKQSYPGYVYSEKFDDNYRQWTTETLDVIRSSLLNANISTSSLQSEYETMAVIQDLSNSAIGQTQAIQAGNMIASEMIIQLQELRMLLASQIYAQGQHMAKEINQEAQMEAIESEFFQVIEESKDRKPYTRVGVPY